MVAGERPGSAAVFGRRARRDDARPAAILAVLSRHRPHAATVALALVGGASPGPKIPRSQSSLSRLPAQHPLDAFDHLLGTDLRHAGVVVRAAAKLPQVARRTRNISPDDGVRPAVRPDPDRVSRPEDAHD